MFIDRLLAPIDEAALQVYKENLKPVYSEMAKALSVDTFNTEIGVSLDFIAQSFGMTRNGFEPHRKSAHLDENIDLINTYEDAVTKYVIHLKTNQPNRAAKTQKAWNDNKDRYANLYKEVKEMRLFLYGGPKETIEHINACNRQVLLDFFKPRFEKYPIEKACKLAYNYWGYANLAHLSFLGCISIMTVDAKNKLERRIDTMASTTAEQFSRLSTYAELIPLCNAILNNEYSSEETSLGKAWYAFSFEANKGSASDLEKVITMYECFNIGDAEPRILEMMIKYALFLNVDEQCEILSFAKAMLVHDNLREPHVEHELDDFFSAVDAHDFNYLLRTCHGLAILELC